MDTSEVTKAYDRWVDATRSGLEHAVCQARWESYMALRDHAGVCGHEDPFGGPCILPAGHGRRHDDRRRMGDQR